MYFSLEFQSDNPDHTSRFYQRAGLFCPGGSKLNEADTCRKYVKPRLQSAGWDGYPHRINEQVTFTDGRIREFLEKPL